MNSHSEDSVRQAHELYERLTGQRLPLHLERQRQWQLILGRGYQLSDIQRVIEYLQKEILGTRRNVGALKLSNLLQPERFEEDLAISRIRLRKLQASHQQVQQTSLQTDSVPRQKVIEVLREFRRST